MKLLGLFDGFDFLDRSAGFGIAQHLIPYVESDSYARVFVIGLLILAWQALKQRAAELPRAA